MEGKETGGGGPYNFFPSFREGGNRMKVLTYLKYFVNFINMNSDKKNSKSSLIKKEGIVLEALPSAQFRIRLDDGKEILAHLSGKLRLHRIRILPGDKVTIELSSYDETRGRIVYRRK